MLRGAMRFLLLCSVLACQVPAPEEPAGLPEQEDEPAARTANRFHPLHAAREEMQERGLIPTGLRPMVPTGYACPEASSFFGARTRGDGSLRDTRFYHGYHSGLDIPVPIGTPILAVARGVVVFEDDGTGDGIAGIQLIIQHAPRNTGLRLWLYSVYKHLAEPSPLQLGEIVEVGQVVGRVGQPGGEHYAEKEGPHVHLTMFGSPVRDYVADRMFGPRAGFWVDPLALFRGPPLRSEEIAELPPSELLVNVPIQLADRTRIPLGTRAVWPVACRSARH
jgi:hypothetical protein